MTKRATITAMYQRLFDLGAVIDEMFEFFLVEGLASHETKKKYHLSSTTTRGKELFTIMEQIGTNPTVQMVDLEWSLLPFERIRILIVTDRTTKEFIYSETGGAA